MSVCNICGKCFVPYYELSSSREIIIDGRTFSICPECSVKFHDNIELRNILLHSGQGAAKQGR